VADLNASVEEYLAGLSNEDWRALSARVRPPEPVDPVSSRQSVAAKAGQLWAVTQQCDENGYQGIAAAAAAKARPVPAQPEPPAPQGFAANRAQSASGDGPPAPVQQSDWSTKPRISPPGGAF